MIKTVAFILTTLPFTGLAKKYTESDYVNYYCTGIIEHRLPDKTRVDCLTRHNAIEYDFEKNWAESIGQAMHYSLLTQKQGGIVLIVTKRAGTIYLERIANVIRANNLKIDLWYIMQDNLPDDSTRNKLFKPQPTPYPL